MTLHNIKIICVNKLRSLSMSACFSLCIGLSIVTSTSLISAQSLAQDNGETDTEENAEANTANLINEPRYISDILYVPLRSGGSSGHRVVHKGLKSGTKITLLEENDSGWARIKTSRGTEGWIQKRYLLAQPTANIQLANAQAQIQKITSKSGPLSEKLLEAESQNRQFSNNIAQLERDKTALNKELKRIKALSGDQIRLDQENKSLFQTNEELNNKLDTLQAENNRLTEELKSDQMMFGALLVFLGMIATLAIQNFTRSKRRSDWG